MFRKKPTIRTTIDSLIGSATRMEGDVVFRGGLRIDGQVRGDVVSDVEPGNEAGGLLVIGEHGRVDGHIVAAHVIVNGTVHGSITASGMVELQPKARVNGELRYRSVEVHRGAKVEGTLSHCDGEPARPELKLAAPANDGVTNVQPVRAMQSLRRTDRY